MDRDLRPNGERHRRHPRRPRHGLEHRWQRVRRQQPERDGSWWRWWWRRWLDFSSADPTRQHRSTPTISGTAQTGQTLTASTGTWTGTAPISFAYQWRRCAGAACTAVAGALASTYVAAVADVGDTLVVRVTASNTAGNAGADSTQTATVAAAPPTNTAAPAISGTAQAGQTLTASTGTWTGTAPIGFTYQWRNCAGSTCGAISGATTSTYSPTASDVGDTIVVRVTGTNGGGSAFADSNPTAIVTSAGTLPVNTVAPSISGTDQVGQTLSASTGTWSGTGPLNYAYQWQRCGAPYPSVVGADSPAAYLRLDDASGTAAVNSGSGRERHLSRLADARRARRVCR